MSHRRTQGALPPHKQALLDYIGKYQPVGSAALFASYDGAGESYAALKRRLHYLHFQGWIEYSGPSHRSVWRLTGERCTPTPPPPRPRRPAPAVGQVALPCEIDVMHAPAYAPQPGTPARAGALDFAALPSLRNGQRQAHRGGYFFL